MADGLLSALFGSAQIQPVTTGPATQNTTQLATTLNTLPTGTLINGFVINRDAQGNPVLRTAQGDVIIKSDVFLKTGSEVVIRLATLGQQIQARIISVDGMPLKDVEQQQLAQQAIKQDQVLMSSMSGSGAAAVDNGAVLVKGMLLGSATTHASPAQVAAIIKAPEGFVQQLQSGATVNFRILSAELQHPTPPIALPGGQAAPLTAENSALLPGTTAASISNAALTVSGSSTPTGLAPLPTMGAALPPASVMAATIAAAASPSLPIGPFSPEPTIGSPATGIATGPGASSPSALPPALPSTTTPPLAQAMPLSVGVPALASSLPALPTDPLRPPAIPSPLPASAANPANAAPAPVPYAFPAAINSLPSAGETGLESRSGIISARVIGTEPNGATILRTAIGTIKLFTAAAPPPGSTLRLEAIIPQSPALASSAPSGAMSYSQQPTIASGTLSLMQHWPALDESLSALQQADPAAARELAARIPNVKSDFVNNALFFISALKAGDMGRWFGGRGQSITQRLQDLAPQSSQRLAADFANLSSAIIDQPDLPWQALMLPLIHDNQLQQWRLYVRDDAEKEQQASSGSRFIVEVDMSELGLIQLDGLLRRHDSTLRLDLAVHSAEPFPEDMQTEMDQLYQKVAGESGFIGSLQFKPGSTRFLQPLAENRQAQMNTGGSDDHSILA